MRMRTGPPAVLLALALAGCGDEDRNPQDFTASLDKTSTSADDSAATPAPVIASLQDTLGEAAPPQDTFAIALAPLGSSPVHGSGRVAAVGKATSISVTLARAVGGATYEGAVRQGVCARMGSSVAPLHPVSADSLGNGRASSDVNVPVDSLTGAPHVVIYGRGGRPEACAAVRPSGAAPLRPLGPPPPPTTAPEPDLPPQDSSGRRRS